MAAEVYPKSRATMPKKIDLSFIRTKAEIKQHLHSALSEIHLACDVWTTEHKKKAFLAVIAHFVDSKGKSQKALLGLPQLRGSHGGQHQAEFVNAIINWYEIAHKLGYYISDNHGSNDKCCRFISRHLGEQYQINQDPKTRWIQCHGHVINLTSQAFIFAPDKEMINAVINKVREEADTENEDEDDTNKHDEEARLAALLKKKKKLSQKDIRPLGKLHRIIAYMRALELLYNEFLDTAGRIILMDNDTQWNSWHAMSMVACELEGFINVFMKNHHKVIRKYALTPDNQD